MLKTGYNAYKYQTDFEIEIRQQGGYDSFFCCELSDALDSSGRNQ